MKVTSWTSRTSSLWQWWLAVVLFIFPPLTLPFNFDILSPVVIHDVFDSPESHFGASVALVAPSSGGGSGWVVIGAPKAASPQSNYSLVQEPGVVWKCSLGGRSRNCSILEVDPSGELDVKIGQVPKDVIHRDKKDFGMFGASMATGRGNSDRFVVCSSRWSNQKYKEHHLMNGLCYWVPKKDLMSHNVTSCDFSNRLLPLVNASRQAYTLPVASGQLAERRFDWAFGQAGFSIDISAKDEILLGAPGILEWAGSVVQYRDYDPIKLNLPNRRFNQKDSTLAQVLVPRAQANINRKVINYFDYFGYAVTSGKFFNVIGGATQYAAGAPRGSSLGGKVLIFSFQDQGVRDIGTLPDESLTFLVDPITGESGNFFGSYFGSTLLAVDVNGDGMDDLLIGAPQYESTATTFQDSGNSSSESSENLSSGDEGCAFLYFSIGEDFERTTPQEICGDNRPGARFGSALCILGDINRDGYKDVAIGAPYEAENRGAVYIYIGSSKRLILSQKLSPEHIDISIRGFGYSLSGEVDIDQNSYGDLAIGAYDSNHVVVFTSRTVVEIYGNLSTSVVTLSTSTGLFTITACIGYKGHSVPDQLEIWMKLSVDPEMRKVRIVEFLPDSRILPGNFSRSVIQFKSSNAKTGTCHTFNVTTIGDLDTVTIPVTVRQAMWLEEPDGKPRPVRYTLQKSSGGHPLLLEDNTGDPETPWNSKLPIEAPASKNLNPPTLSIPITTICEEDGDPSCLAHLSISATFRTTEGTSLMAGEKFVIGSSRSLILHVELTNLRERANLPLILEISWSNPLTLRSSRSDCKRVDMDEDEHKLYVCSLPTPLSKNKKETLELDLDTSGLYVGGGEDVLSFGFKANTSSLLVKDELRVELPLSHKSQLVLIGQSSEASYYDNITAETVNFTQLYDMGLTGLSPIYGVEIQVALPLTVLVQGVRLPLLRIREPITTYDRTKMTCRAVNATFYEEVSSDDLDDELVTGRAKRSTSQRPSLQHKKTTLMEQPIIINCQTPNVECFLVECDVYFFKPSYRVLVEFRLRLVTETARTLFTETDRDVMIIESMSRAKRLGTTVQEERFAISKTLIRAELPGEIKAWILIVATGGGIAIFTLITIFLMHCGFFRRAKLEELTKLRAGQGSVFAFDDELEMVDSLEYFDGGLTSSDFDYRYSTGTQFRPLQSYSDEIYDELE